MGSADPEGGRAADSRKGGRLTGPVTAPAAALPRWATLHRAPNPGPMTLTGTNSWVLRAPGATDAVVVDPGPADEDHLAALARSGPVSAILVTHGHPDHVDGLPRLVELTGATVHGGAEPLADGQVIQTAGLRIEALATPGHTRDSASFLVSGPASSDGASGDVYRPGPSDGPSCDVTGPAFGDGASGDVSRTASGTGSGAGASGDRAVLTGDTVLGAGSTVVMWPDGDLGAYLASLARLRDLGPLPVLPGHGPPLADCSAAAGGYLAHRTARLDQVRAALAGGATGVGEVLDRVYPELEPALRPAAELTVRAQLAYLDRDREHSDGLEPLDRP